MLPVKYSYFYNMRSSLVLLVFLLTTICRAQNPLRDSLEHALQGGKEDTIRVQTLNALAVLLMNSDPEKGIDHARKALALTERLGWKKGAGTAYQAMGRYAYIQGDQEAALSYLQKGLRIYEDLGDKAGTAKLLGNLGIIYKTQGNYPKAFEYYLKTLKLAGELTNKNIEAQALGNIGNIYMNQRDYPKALDHLLRAYQKAIEVGNMQNAQIHLGNIAVVYDESGDTAKAGKYYIRRLRPPGKLATRMGRPCILETSETFIQKVAVTTKRLGFICRVMRS